MKEDCGVEFAHTQYTLTGARYEDCMGDHASFWVYLGATDALGHQAVLGRDIAPPTYMARGVSARLCLF